jgi:peptidoglycan/xylan/chitin deacetylase (PgdA/CDA1 family)
MSKRSKLALLRLMKNAGVFRFAREASQGGVRILCYHGLWRGADRFTGDSMFMLAQSFEARLEFLRRLAFNVISLDEAIAALRDDTPLPSDSVVITIDDGWYSTYAQMLPALKRQGMHATIYCDTKNLLSALPVPHVMARYLRQISAPEATLAPRSENAFSRATNLTLDAEARYSAALEFADSLGINASSYDKRRAFSYMTEAELVQASRDGFSIELHSHSHSLADFSFSRVREEITVNREVLGQIMNKPPAHFRHFCYPSGRVPPDGGDALRRLGIISATTLETGISYPGADLLLLPRIVDGDHLSELEFEAELCGVGDFLRKTRAVGSDILSAGRRRFSAVHQAGTGR